VFISASGLTDYLHIFQPELWQNGDLAEDEALKNLWHWLYLSRSLVEDGSMQGVDSKLPGIR
jgi:hypothetical protein